MRIQITLKKLTKIMEQMFEAYDRNSIRYFFTCKYAWVTLTLEGISSDQKLHNEMSCF